MVVPPLLTSWAVPVRSIGAAWHGERKSLGRYGLMNDDTGRSSKSAIDQVRQLHRPLLFCAAPLQPICRDAGYGILPGLDQQLVTGLRNRPPKPQLTCVPRERQNQCGLPEPRSNTDIYPLCLDHDAVNCAALVNGRIQCRGARHTKHYCSCRRYPEAINRRHLLGQRAVAAP